MESGSRMRHSDLALIPLSDATFGFGGPPVDGFSDERLDTRQPCPAHHGIGGGGGPPDWSAYFVFDGPTQALSRTEQLTPGTTYAATITTQAANSAVGVIPGRHVALATEIDANPVGAMHAVTISPDATHLHMDSASATEQFSVRLGADVSPSYGRALDLAGVALAPGMSVDVSTDAAAAGFTLSSTGASDQVLGGTLLQAGQNGGTLAGTFLLPSNGGKAALTVINWNDLAHSLVYELSVTATGGSPTARIIQDNPGQRQSAVASDLAALRTDTNTVTDSGVQRTLQGDVGHAQEDVREGDADVAGDPTSAARHYFRAASSLTSLLGEVSAQAGKGVPQATAQAMTASANDAIGLLVAAAAQLQGGGAAR